MHILHHFTPQLLLTYYNLCWAVVASRFSLPWFLTHSFPSQHLATSVSLSFVPCSTISCFVHLTRSCYYHCQLQFLYSVVCGASVPKSELTGAWCWTRTFILHWLRLHGAIPPFPKTLWSFIKYNHSCTVWQLYKVILSIVWYGCETWYLTLWDEQETEENCITRSCMICASYNMCIRWSNQRGWNGWGMWHAWGRTRYRWQSYIKMCCNVTGLVSMDWIYLAQDMDKWWVLWRRKWILR